MTTFDTLKAAQALKQAGYDEAQATAIVALQAEATADRFVTNEKLEAELGKLRLEIGELRSALRSEIAELHGRLGSEIDGVKAVIGSLKAEMFRQLGILGAGIVATTVALTKLLQ